MHYDSAPACLATCASLLDTQHYSVLQHRHLATASTMDSVTILLKYVAPSVGCVTAIINYFSPMPRVWQVRREKVLKVSNTSPPDFILSLKFLLFMHVTAAAGSVGGTDAKMYNVLRRSSIPCLWP